MRQRFSSWAKIRPEYSKYFSAVAMYRPKRSPQPKSSPPAFKTEEAPMTLRGFFFFAWNYKSSSSQLNLIYEQHYTLSNVTASWNTYNWFDKFSPKWSRQNQERLCMTTNELLFKSLLNKIKREADWLPCGVALVLKHYLPLFTILKGNILNAFQI